MLYLYGTPSDQAGGHRAVYALLERAYTQLCGGPLPPVARTEAGKPYFLHDPTEFSLTHTKNMAFCALSDHAVGVDAETVRPVRPGVAERTMNPEELAWLAEQPDRDRAFLTLWTMKESWVKLTGKGLGGRPQDVVLTWSGGAAAVQGERVCFQTRELEGCMVTVCTAYHGPAVWTLLPDSYAE